MGEADDGIEAVDLVRRIDPDLLLLDWALPPLSGLGVLTELSGLPHAVRPLLLATSVETPELLRAVRLGARGVLYKESATRLVSKSIRSVMAGQWWLGRDLVSDLARELSQPQSAVAPESHPRELSLTPREVQVLSLIVAGHTNRSIARELSLSEETIKHHLSRIFRKTGTFNRVELARVALRSGLVHSQQS